MELSGYGGMFFSALLAATIFPAQSEAVLLALTASGRYSLWVLFVVASIGNILGAVVNWWLGLGIERFHQHPWFPIREKALHRAQAWYHRYGKWSLLLSWMPIIGDPLTVAAGVMRERFPVFLGIVAIAKAGRYGFLLMAYHLAG